MTEYGDYNSVRNVSSQGQGSFADDLRHWCNIGLAHPGVQHGWWQHLRLIWTYHPLRATALLRLSQWCHRKHIRLVPGILRRLNITLHGLDIVESVPIGGGLYMPHTVGTVVMASSIGRNVTFVSGVTIGMRNHKAFPTIGNDVFVGAGARILGAVTIGDGAVIGANAVVLTDVPPGATAVGVPARIIQRPKQAGNTDPNQVDG